MIFRAISGQNGLHAVTSHDECYAKLSDFLRQRHVCYTTASNSNGTNNCARRTAISLQVSARPPSGCPPGMASHTSAAEFPQTRPPSEILVHSQPSDNHFDWPTRCSSAFCQHMQCARFPCRRRCEGRLSISTAPSQRARILTLMDGSRLEVGRGFGSDPTYLALPFAVD